FHRRLDGAVRGDDDHADLGRDLLAGLEDLEAVHPGQAKVGDDNLERLLPDQIYALEARRRDLDLAPFRLQRVRDRDPHERLVVDDQDVRLRPVVRPPSQPLTGPILSAAARYTSPRGGPGS